jgi:hypothetical protein
MNGIPVKVWRDGAQETVYLSCARVGAAGEAIAALKREVRLLLREQANHARKLALLQVKADAAQKTEAGPAVFEALLSEQEDLLEKLNEAGELHLEKCQELWIAALAPNHGPDAEGVLNCLSDRQVASVLKMLELGECPADFFLSNAAPGSGNGTGLSCDSLGECSSKKDSPPTI